ncbi:hypothetical protein V8C43DRAFT_311812 [Trichoderma afarasin]
MSTSHHIDLELLLANNNIFPEGFRYQDCSFVREPSNLSDILSQLSASRSGHGEGSDSRNFRNFLTFQEMNHSLSRSTIMRRVIPVLEGIFDDRPLDLDNKNDGGIELDNLTPLVEGVEVVLQPDYFDGVAFAVINKQARYDLGGLIIPSKHMGAPIAPNFFLEVRRPSGNAVTTKTEACYYGACGARAMHAIQNYDHDETLKYDEKAYSFSSTYINGLLKIYAHFIVEPDEDTGGLPAYHMFELKAFNMTSTYDDFIAGCAAFRNARELAADLRHELISSSGLN